MLRLPLTETERKLLSFTVWPAAGAAVVAGAYVLAGFLSIADRPDPWGTLALDLAGFTPTWLVLGVAAWTNRSIAAGWVDTSIVVPSAAWLVLLAAFVVGTTDYANHVGIDAWCVASALPCVSAAAAVGALALTLRRRWLRRDPTRWTPRWEH